MSVAPLEPVWMSEDGRQVDFHLPCGVILLVEDNEADADLTREAFVGGMFHSELHVVRDGRSALAFLRQEGAYAGAPPADLVLLDLNLPGMDGRMVLDAVKSDPRLRHVPVIVLSSSAAPADIHAAYGAGANCYVTKPVGLREFLSTVRAVERFWIGIATLPPHPR